MVGATVMANVVLSIEIQLSALAVTGEVISNAKSRFGESGHSVNVGPACVICSEIEAGANCAGVVHVWRMHPPQSAIAFYM